MPWSTAATLGAVAAMRSLISSSPLTTYLSWHGVPELTGLEQFRAISVKPMSLPPMPMLTIRVFESSESNWGGLGPSGETFCGSVMSFVSAPLQLASVYADEDSIAPLAAGQLGEALAGDAAGLERALAELRGEGIEAEPLTIGNTWVVPSRCFT